MASVGDEIFVFQSLFVEFGMHFLRALEKEISIAASKEIKLHSCLLQSCYLLRLSTACR